MDNEDGDTPTISRVMASSDGPLLIWPDLLGQLAIHLRLHDRAGDDPNEFADPDPDLLRMIHNGREFQLFKIIKPKP